MEETVLKSVSYTFSTNALPTLLACFMSLSLGLLVLTHERHSSLNFYFFITTLTISIWFFSFTWMYSAVTPKTAFFWAKAAYLGLPFIPSAIYHFTVKVVREKSRVYLFIARLSWLVAACFSGIIVGTDLMIQGLYLYPWGYYPQYGWFGWIGLVFCVMMMALTFHLYLRNYKKTSSGFHQKRVRLFAIAFGIFYLSSVDFLAKFGVPLYPFGYATTLVFLAVSAFVILRYRFVDLTPAFAVNQILETMEGVVFVSDPQGSIRFANPAASQMLGYESKELLNQSIEKICSISANLEKTNSFESLRDHVMEWEKKNGEKIWVRVSTSHLKDPKSGDRVGVVCVAFDVTALKKAEEALRENEKYNRNLFEQSPIGLALCRMDGTLVDVNPAYAKIIGRSVEETLKLTYWDVTPEKYAKHEAIQLENLKETGRYGPYEKEYIHKNGHLVPVRLSGLFIEKKGERYIWSSVEDISQKRRTEDALLQKSAELAGANLERKQLELFAYVASHDLQEPLQKIIGFGDLLKSNAQENMNEKARDYVDRMQNAASRMSRLIQDLLQLSRVALTQAPMTRCNLGDIVKGVLQDLEMRIMQSGAKVAVADLPTVQANEAQMRQLFQNLISNALKFHKEKQAPCVFIEARDIEQGFVEIIVRDEGIGFDIKHADRIFKPFERLHGPADYEGSGIGLAVCEKIVDRHGGKIEVKSAIDEGASFSVQLPACEPVSEKGARRAVYG